jgi:hydroxymethylbilane synthase
MKTIRIVTRTSELAMWQARFIEQALNRLNPDIKIELIGIKTQGDKILDVSLSKVGGKGLFVKELEDQLLNHSADLAVHSLKDVPYQLPSGLVLAAFGEREDPRDALISPNYTSLAMLPKGATVGTSSLRRQAQLLKIRPDLRCDMLRGNVPTRIQKCVEGQYEAIILAAAGVKRLGLADHIREYLDINTFLPAVGQGVLGIECHEKNQALIRLLGPLNHLKTYITSLAERSMNETLEGGCQVPIAGYAWLEPVSAEAPALALQLYLKGRVLTPDGKTCLESQGEISVNLNNIHPEDIIQLGKKIAHELIQQGADKIISACYSQVKS